uniref:Uncharacterized protein n=1 Tax=Solanum tuberosum TaxID=4113 RepID=M0ZW27_SOLTU
MRHQNTAISDDMHAFPASFGFKGEALSSISDVYLLELLPKLMRGQMDIDGKGFCTLELMSVDKMIVQHMCFSFSLLLLSSGFGIHLSSLNKSVGAFKLLGYISGPDVYTVKTVKVYMPKLMDKEM